MSLPATLPQTEAAVCLVFDVFGFFLMCILCLPKTQCVLVTSIQYLDNNCSIISLY